MSYRIFDYTIKCPFCGKWMKGDIGGEHSFDYEIWCQNKKCGKEIQYEMRVEPYGKEETGKKLEGG